MNLLINLLQQLPIVEVGHDPGDLATGILVYRFPRNASMCGGDILLLLPDDPDCSIEIWVKEANQSNPTSVQFKACWLREVVSESAWIPLDQATLTTFMDWAWKADWGSHDKALPPQEQGVGSAQLDADALGHLLAMAQQTIGKLQRCDPSDLTDRTELLQAAQTICTINALQQQQTQALQQQQALNSFDMTLLAAVAYGMAGSHSKVVELLEQLPERPLTTGVAVVILLLLYQSDIDHRGSWYTRITTLMQEQREEGTLTDLYLAIADLDDDQLELEQVIDIKNRVERILTEFFHSDEISAFEKTLLMSCRPVLKRVLAKRPQILDAGVAL